MKNNTALTTLVFLITILSAWATITAIISNDGPGPYSYQSIRGKTITIYGRGLYKDMSAEVAPQGIAQDYVTLCIGIPLLLISLRKAQKGFKRGQYVLAGVLGYFLVTYLFYTVMGMYNQLFLVYVFLMGTSFYSFILALLSIATKGINTIFKPSTPTKATGIFLLFNAITIGFLWLSIIVPPLFNGTVIPDQVEHYTTLIVQGMDLGILLPAAFICGVLWMKKRRLGYLLTPVYFIFLSVLMTALTAKVIAMALLGHNVIPVIFIIPAFNLLTLICSIIILKNIVERSTANQKTYYEAPIIA